MKESFIMISRYLNHFRQSPGSVVFEPAVDANLTRIDAAHTSTKFYAITGENRKFIKLKERLIFNGIEFYGSIPHYREKKNYTFPNLITVNEYYLNYDYFIRKLVIGRISENILLYDGAENVYSVTDRINLRPVIEAENLSAFLKIFYDHEVASPR